MTSPIGTAWKHRDLRVLVIGEGVSVFGSMVSRLALPWTAARELGQGTLSVGLVFTVELLPVALLGLFAGALVDRWSRRRVLIVTNLALATTTAVVTVLAVLDRLSMTAIYAVGFVSGCIVPFFTAAFRSTVPITVPLESLAAAQSIVQGVSAVAELAASADPLFAGAVVTAAAALCLTGREVRRVHDPKDVARVHVSEISA